MEIVEAMKSEIAAARLGMKRSFQLRMRKIALHRGSERTIKELRGRYLPIPVIAPLSRYSQCAPQCHVAGKVPPRWQWHVRILS